MSIKAAYFITGDTTEKKSSYFRNCFFSSGNTAANGSLHFVGVFQFGQESDQQSDPTEDKQTGSVDNSGNTVMRNIRAFLQIVRNVCGA